MTVPGSLRWPLTLVLLAVTAFHAVRLAYWLIRRDRRRSRHLSEALHVVMGAGMLVMSWPWSATVPAIAWATVFAPVTAWFAHLAAADRPAHRTEHVNFAVAAAAMAWMTATMTTPGTAHTHGPAITQHLHGTAAATPWWSTSTSALLGSYLVLAAIWWAARNTRLTPQWPTPAPGATTVEDRPHPPSPQVPASTRLAQLCHCAMSAAMALMILAPL